MRGGASQRIGFSDTSGVSDSTSATERVFGDRSGLGHLIRISDSGSSDDGWSKIDSAGSGALVSYTFLDPQSKLSIDAGDGDDTFIHNGFDGAIAGKVLLSGGGGSDAVTGPPQDTDWYITGENAGDVTGVSFVEVENLIGSTDNEDTFFVSASGGLSGVMDGGTGGFDSLVFTGGAFSSVIYTAFEVYSGTVNRDGVVLTYRIELTAAGREELAERSEAMGGIWTNRIRREEGARQALSALTLFSRNEHYLVHEGKVQIIDEYTGRVMAD